MNFCFVICSRERDGGGILFWGLCPLDGLLMGKDPKKDKANSPTARKKSQVNGLLLGFFLLGFRPNKCCTTLPFVYFVGI
jgi:hypothetical protein